MRASEGDVRNAMRKMALPPLLGGVFAVVVLAVFFAIGPVIMRTEVVRGYLIAYILWFAISVGSLGLGLVQAATSGEWGLPLIRIYGAAGSVRSFALLGVAFLPIALSLPLIYPWVAHQDGYLNPAFFIARSYAYLIVLVLLAGGLQRSRTGSPTRPGFGAAGLVGVFLVGTFATFDWMMSLTPDWTSTIYGLLFLITAGLAAHSHAIALVRRFRMDSPYARLLSPGLTRDWGNLLLTILMLWAYFNYSQYIVIWSGDIKREIPYFVARSSGGWNALTVVLIVLGFIGPLLALTSPTVKASVQLLGRLSNWLLAVAWLDLVWMVAPDLSSNRLPLMPWLVIVAFVGIGGLWRWNFLSVLRSTPLVPHEDERIRRVLDHASA